MNTVIGIDFGISSSSVSVIEDGKPVVVAKAGENRAIPSAVALAKRLSISTLQSMVFSSDRVGRDTHSRGLVDKQRKPCPPSGNPTGGPDLEVVKYTHRSLEASTLAFRTLKESAEAYLGGPVNQAIVSVPACFDGAQRQATKEAGRLAGLEILQVIDGPAAAALAVCRHLEIDPKVRTRILLAGVPFGCDNVGDEAILACAVAIFREVAPDAILTVSTSNREYTARWLGVETCDLLGFAYDDSPAEMRKIIDQHDCFVWCGATGLSDYPQVATKLMMIAQELGKKTILWGVGMNNKLTPSHHRVYPGKRRTLYKMLTALTLRAIDVIDFVEKRRNAKSRNDIKACLDPADLVVVRDNPSRNEVLKCGVSKEVVVGADSAIRLKPADLSAMTLTPGLRELLHSDRPKIGLCVSAQSKILQERDLLEMMDDILEETNGVLIGIPMNPLTDSALMARMVGRMRSRDRAAILTGEYMPDEILAIAAKLDVIVSSRLHLLILAANVNVPIVGIARGSKVNNFLENFGLNAPGNVEDCDFDNLKQEIRRLLGEDGVKFRRQSVQVMAELRQRLDAATERLAETLHTIA